MFKRFIGVSVLIIFVAILFFNTSTNEDDFDSNTTFTTKTTSDKTNTHTAPANQNEQTTNDKELLLNDCNFNLDQVFKKDDLKVLSKDQLVILRNAIYAKHGYMFTKKKYHDYFIQFDWYMPTNCNVSQLLTAIDNENIKKILQLEQVLEKLHFKSTKLGFSITFPENWSGKYKIKEYDTYMIVYFNPSEKIDFIGGEFFLIIDTESAAFHQDTHDTVVDESFFIANNRKYFIGGPTDFPLPDNHPELDLFLKMKSQIPNIIKTIQPL